MRSANSGGNSYINVNSNAIIDGYGLVRRQNVYSPRRYRFAPVLVGHGARLALIGLVLGVGLALASASLIEGMLFNVPARDPWSFVAVAASVALACLAACYIPGRRALRVDPMSALRAE